MSYSKIQITVYRLETYGFSLPYFNMWQGSIFNAVLDCDNPEWIYQRTSTKLISVTVYQHCLPWPAVNRCNCTVSNSWNARSRPARNWNETKQEKNKSNKTDYAEWSSNECRINKPVRHSTVTFYILFETSRLKSFVLVTPWYFCGNLFCACIAWMSGGNHLKCFKKKIMFCNIAR